MSQSEMDAPEPAAAHRSRTVKRRLLWNLRQQWKLLGLFEIDKGHEFYDLTCMMKEGLSASVQNTIDNPALDELSEEDFKEEVTQVHEGYKMQTFAGPVFARLRRSLGMSEKDYQHSLSCEGFYLQFISNSKSKADFFLTNDKRFFLKTQNKREVKFLLSNLKIYIQHLESYPHSLLVKFLGVHRIKIPRQREKYFIVMQSVFYPDERIHDRYDIKGCQVSRWTDPAPEGSQIIVVLKDMNFEGKSISLDQQRSWLLRQMDIDTAFLRRLNVLDYSLLVAHQPLHHDEKGQRHSLASVIMRTKKSVITGSSPIHSSSPPVPGVVEEDSAVLVSEMEDGLDRCRVREVLPGHGSSPLRMLDGPSGPSAELREFQAQNRRLLPNFKNPLHVIDGPELRYFVGIIDIFTVYGFKKKLEHLWKCLRYPGQAFSTVSPSAYSSRLCQWVEAHTN
ncbi:phosphatidylinositol 4-phosphate 5-kinase-like protein 1 [Amia ocellicauda]|uniref:phosphatidylinositol 4-phosphate 5-kinase-like protein 1 n=1 Tax=Amia ocellicauda TaxID=2972642 RepID=UPI0034642556